MLTQEIQAALNAAMMPIANEVRRLNGVISQMEAGDAGGLDEISSMPGRRIFFNYVGTQTFASTDTRGNAIPFLISQDGPFVLTHFPFIMWKVSAPTTATNYGRWRPVNTAYLPTQQLTSDFIDISYEIVDSGSQRQFQNLPMAPLTSDPVEWKPLPMPTIFRENSTIQFIPTYQDINFSGGGSPTQGTLVVVLPGYRIITGATGNY